MNYYCPYSMALYSLGLISENRSSLPLGCPDKGPYNNRFYIRVFYTPHSSNLPFQNLIFFDFFKFLCMFPNFPRNSCVYNYTFFFSFLPFLVIIIIIIIITIIILLSTSVLPGWFLDCAGVWATLFLSLENKADGLVCLFELWLPRACVSSGRLDSLGKSGPFWSVPDVCCWAAVLVKLVREA